MGTEGESGQDRYQKKIMELDMIWRINEQIMSFESLETLLKAILKASLEVMEATSGSIMLNRPARQRYHGYKGVSRSAQGRGE
ncbi:MAG: hypothetical protein SWK76_07355 [Actinomycetota bacterium]|nr:hypothetical protein [Actinomycetota bacterium]